MDSIIASRIRERMQALGKNPSQVALEAGLGRSAVRDILSGKAKNPQFMTLARIALALECVTSYLTGDVDEPLETDMSSRHTNFEQRSDELSGFLETGVYRRYKRLMDLPHADFDNFEVAEPFGLVEERPFRSEQRFRGRDLLLFSVRDNALGALSILSGDVLTVLSAKVEDGVRIRPGQLLVCRFLPDGFDAYELSAREVFTEPDGRMSFQARSREHYHPPIILLEDEHLPSDKGHPRFSAQGGTVEVFGHVVRVSREVPLS